MGLVERKWLKVDYFFQCCYVQIKTLPYKLLVPESILITK